MNATPQNDVCTGCAISKQDCQDKHVPRILAHGGILLLRGNWVLHHYVGSEGFLGWLALQPYEHREKLSCLSDDEAKEFGGLLKAIEEGLDAYWKEEFQKDPLERVYVACFYESSEHLHFHIVPRPKSFTNLDISTVAYSASEEIERETRYPYGWHVYLATRCHQFPDRYRREEQKSKKLMEFLKMKLTLA